MKDLLGPLAELSPSQLELLQVQLAKLNKSQEKSLSAPILARKRNSNTAPLSFAQQRIWFANRLSPESAAYNIVNGFRLTGCLELAVLEQTFNEQVQRHGVFRTTFEAVNEQPIQVIAVGTPFRVLHVNLKGFFGAEQVRQLQRLAAEDACRPFDLRQNPLLRVTLLWLTDTQYVMLVTLHHIIADYWSLGVMLREMALLYGAFSKGGQSPLAELPIQYCDYAEWQREWLQGQELETQLSYWRQRLAGPLPVLELPADGRITQDRRGGTQSLRLSERLSNALRTLSHNQGCSLSMTLLAAFKALLYRLTRQSDVVVGLTIANRNRSEIEGLIGFFVNTLALRTDLSDDLSFLQLLRRVRERCLEAYGHQDLPFEKLVEELQPERRFNRHPIFDVLFNSLNASSESIELPGLVVSNLERDDPESKFALTFNVEESARRIGLRVVYQHSLFSPERIGCLLNQYKHLLEQVVANPQGQLSCYSLVTVEDRFVLPDPRSIIPEPYCEPITAQFASWAERTCEQLAICQGDRNWTYEQLAQAASRLALRVRAHTVNGRDVVAVTGRRSFGLVASMLAVLSSGAVLLTLDQNLPDERKRLMLKESGARSLIYVGQPPDEKCEQEHWLPTINVDPESAQTVEPAKAHGSEDRAWPRLSPDDPAYIFFTSGTTGVPKAVLGCHKGLSHFVGWQRQAFGVGPNDRCAQLTSPSFDVVLREIFLPLTSGATLCLPEVDHLGPEGVTSWLERQQVSLLHAVPTLAQTWLATVPAGLSLRAVRWLFLAGEPLTEALVRRWRQTFPEAANIVNLYGPTETTLAKCFFRIPSDIPQGIQPLGRPIPQTQILVLTENLKLCGISEPGQIAVRTPYRSLGYLNAPEENQKRFIRNPFSGDESDLLYLTGDIGRYRVDGSLEILGRLDQQIKIHGVRVEPGEVAAILSRHPCVASCAVVGRDDDQGQKMLVAYVVSSAEDLTPADLRSHLTKYLPMVMVPAAFVFLERLPLTPNGKTDWRALPAPARAEYEIEEHFVAPRTTVEEVVAGIWAAVLGLDRVGIHDDFFYLSGHSLLATQVISRVRDAFQVEVPLHKLFEQPTVAGLASNIDALQQAGEYWLPSGIQSGAIITRSQDLTEQVPINIDLLSDQQVDDLFSALLAGNDILQ